MIWSAQNTDNLQATLDLPPLHEPPPVEFTFEATGWIILFALVSALVLVVLVWQALKFRKNRYRREAIKRIQNLDTSVLDPVSIFVELKLVATQTFGRESVSGLQGKQWMQFLDDSSKGTSFSHYAEEYLASIYEGSSLSKSSSQVLMKDAINWIRYHA